MSDNRIPVVVASAEGLSGVISWGYRLRAAFENHPKYRVILVDCRLEENVTGLFDVCAPSKRKITELLDGLPRAVVIPNFIYDVYPICAEFIAAGKEIRIVGMCHADSQDEYYAPLSFCEPMLSHFVPVSAECARKLRERLPDRVADITMLPYGIPVPHEVQRSYETAPIRMLYAGRVIQQQKRVMDFVPLVEHLLRLGVDFHFDILGGGPELNALKEAMAQVPHEGRVQFHARVLPDKMEAMWLSHEVFVQVSDYEGTSISMLECLAMATVPVMTRVESGVEGLIVEGENAFLAPVGDMESLALAIQRLATEPGLLERMGAAAHESSKPYSLDAYADKFTAILDKTTEGPVRSWPTTRDVMEIAEFPGQRLSE